MKRTFRTEFPPFTVILSTLLIAMTACAPAASQVQPITALPSAAPVTEIAAVSTNTPSASPTASAGWGALAAAGANAPTATPRDNNLPAGKAQEIAAATDTAMKPEIENPMQFDVFPVSISFDEFYDGYNLRTGLVLSDKLVSLDGQNVVMDGYMAPPLKPELDYFVLTRIRLAFCPFCTNASDWPDDIALVYMGDQTTTATQYPVRISGRMEVGASVDEETGMVSLVRIYADELEVLN